MNRTIKFRGKRIDNGEWVYGSLVVEENKYYIVLSINDNIKRDDYDVYMLEVIPETIGQFTGLHDKNGKEIYEGDIVKIKYRNEDIGKVIYEHNAFLIDVTNMNRFYGRVDFVNNFMEIMSNKYDNPELLRGEWRTC